MARHEASGRSLPISETELFSMSNRDTISSGNPGTVDDISFAEDDGLHKGLGQRQIQMIAMGSAIGTGLFLGTGGRLAVAGPTVAVLYLICGLFGYLILRSLGEMIIYRPSSGSFVSYTREFWGEKAAYTAGWLYWFNWAMTAVADATAIAIYIQWFKQYWPAIGDIPQWVYALAVVVLVVAANLVSVKLFGEMEFWFSMVKVGSLLIFLVVGTFFVIFGSPSGEPTGLSLINSAGGMLPNGFLPAIVLIQGVVFAYAGIELVGTASGEAKDVEKVIPKAIRLTMVRISLFYVGSVVLLCLLLPYNKYSDDESPFVTFFSSIGVGAAGPIMQLIVITAAFSSLNAGLYSTGRILRSLSMAGSGPRFGAKLNKKGVPFGGILLTSVVAFAGVFLNFIVPDAAFEVMLNLAALGTMASWAAIVLSHIRFVQRAKKGDVNRPHYRAPLTPFMDYLTLVFLVGVVILMAFDYPVGTYTLATSVLFWPALYFGWKALKNHHPVTQAEVDAGKEATPPGTPKN